jgi:hypothetical protein
MHGRGRTRLVAALATLTALAGCGASGTGTPAASLPGPDLPVTVAPGAHVCLDRPAVRDLSSDAPAARARPRVGDAPVARVVVCDSARTARVPGRGEWQVRTERQAIGGVDALVAALRLPDVPQQAAVACAAYADVVPELWVVDGGGRALLVRWPVDVCGHLRPEASQALAAVSWRQTGTRRVQQVTPQSALDAGCQVAVKDVAAIEGTSSAVRGPGSLDGLTGAPGASVCVYRVTDPTPQGDFERGAKLRGRPWATLVAHLRATPPARPGCATVGRRFAEILLGEKGTLALELDGCRRILTPDGGLRQVTPAVLADLAAVG